MKEKGAVLMLVLGILLVVVILANIILGIVSSQFRLTQHQVGRIKAYYAARGMMNYTFDMLRKGTWTPNLTNETSGINKYACLNACIDQTATYPIITDNDIPYHVQVTIYPKYPEANRDRIDIKTEYTSQP